jgi:hypothetical protein
MSPSFVLAVCGSVVKVYSCLIKLATVQRTSLYNIHITPTTESYWSRVLAQARADTRAFWTAHRTATTLGTPIVVAVVWATFKGWHGWTDIWQVVIVSVLAFAVLVGIVFVVSLVLAPPKLDIEHARRSNARQAIIENLTNRITDLETKPEIRGEAYGFALDTMRNPHENAHKRRVGFVFMLDLRNHHNVSTNLVAIELDGSALPEPVTFSNLEYPHHVLLEYAKAVTITVAAVAEATYESGVVKEIALDNLKLYVIDGLQGRHEIAAKPGEKLSVYLYG